MWRYVTAGALFCVMLASALPAAAAGGQFGLFRTRASYMPIEQRNCWVQAKVSGETINGDLISDHMTEGSAVCALHREILAGRCINQTASDVPAACHTPHPHHRAE